MATTLFRQRYSDKVDYHLAGVEIADWVVESILFVDLGILLSYLAFGWVPSVDQSKGLKLMWWTMDSVVVAIAVIAAKES